MGAVTAVKRWLSDHVQHGQLIIIFAAV